MGELDQYVTASSSVFILKFCGPTRNSNVVRVDQPAGTGFSVGTPAAKDEQDIDVDFVNFLTQFQK